MSMDFINQYFIEAKNIIDKIYRTQISKMVSIIHELRSNKGRMFILGVGGGAGHKEGVGGGRVIIFIKK